MDKIEMCKIITPYRCNKCGQDTLFFYTKNNMLIDYKLLFSKGMTMEQIRQYLESKDIRYLKCINCNKLFIIDWTHGFPFALTDKSSLLKFGYQ